LNRSRRCVFLVHQPRDTRIAAGNGTHLDAWAERAKEIAGPGFGGVAAGGGKGRLLLARVVGDADIDACVRDTTDCLRHRRSQRSAQAEIIDGDVQARPRRRNEVGQQSGDRLRPLTALLEKRDRDRHRRLLLITRESRHCRNWFARPQRI
jgi:hypothetical protein